MQIFATEANVTDNKSNNAVEMTSLVSDNALPSLKYKTVVITHLNGLHFCVKRLVAYTSLFFY